MNSNRVSMNNHNVGRVEIVEMGLLSCGTTGTTDIVIYTKEGDKQIELTLFHDGETLQVVNRCGL